MRISIVWLLPVLLLGLALGHGLPRTGPATPAAGAAQPLDELAGGQKRYVCPMHPDVVSDHPGTCPICGMNLVEDHHHAHAAAAGRAGAGRYPVVAVSPAVASSLGVRTEQVRLRTLWRRARTSGRVTKYEAGRRRPFRALVAGRLVEVGRHAVGDWVEAGELLYAIDSPARRAAQKAFLAALAADDAAGMETAIRQLRDQGFTGRDIQRLRASRQLEPRLEVRVPRRARLVRFTATEGKAVQAGDLLAELQPMGEAVVEADIFRNEAVWVKRGDPVEMQLDHLPGRVWKGHVAQQGTYLNPRSKTYRVFMAFPMPEGIAWPDMYGAVTILGGAKRKVLAVPRDALIRTGSEIRVVTALGDGRFQPRVVQVGMMDDDYVEITQGLKPGERVVVAAQFLIDSESNLRAGLRRLEDDGSAGDG